jgi:hypothetical protein
MYQRSSSLLLRFLRVPPEPQPPHGNPASLRVFRAGKDYFNLRLVGWGLAQLVALAGIIFWLVVFLDVEASVKSRRQAHEVPVSPLSVKNFDEYVDKIGADDAAREKSVVQSAAPVDGSAKPAEPVKKKHPRNRINDWAGFKRVLSELALWLPPWSFPLIWALKILGFLVYLAQIPVTYSIRRLDYEMRWYMVTDRSLRIRHGTWKISESTMSFANIQQVVVSQGPLQRVLGLADVKVQSAGGGSGGGEHAHGHSEDMHLGLFHSVTNAPEIRDLILERLRRFRESGLGDPEEKRIPLPAPPAQSPPIATDLLGAARELLAEAKALRASLG